MLVLVLLGIFCVVATLILLNLLGKLNRAPFLAKGGGTHPGGACPFISVIVPMRNEERNVLRCIEGLIAQDYDDYEIIAVDDGSSDNTLPMLRELEREHSMLSIVECAEKPDGWIGKNFALVEGVKRARGALLLFVDADTYAEPELLSTALAYLEERRLDMLSLFPFQEVRSFWERVVQPTVFTAIAATFPFESVNDPEGKHAAACGQFILIRREVYDAVGGHEAVRDKIVEDFELAKLVKGRGYRLGVADGRGLIRTRMYEGLAEVWEGWTKNLFPGIEHDWWMFARGFVRMFAWGLLPTILLIVFSVRAFYDRGAGWVDVAIILECLWLVSLNVFLSLKQSARLGIPRRYALLCTLGYAMFLALVAASAYKVTSGRGVTWKGRTYRDV